MPFTDHVLLVEAMLPPISQPPPHTLVCLVDNKVVSTVELVLVEGSGQVSCSVMVYRVYMSYSNIFTQEQRVVGYWDICWERQGVLIIIYRYMLIINIIFVSNYGGGWGYGKGSRWEHGGDIWKLC